MRPDGVFTLPETNCDTDTDTDSYNMQKNYTGTDGVFTLSDTDTDIETKTGAITSGSNWNLYTHFYWSLCLCWCRAV